MKNVTKLRAALECFRSLDPEIPIQQVVIFLIIAENNDIPDATSQRDLSEALGIAISSVSRNLAALREEDRWGRSGHLLIDIQPDPKHSQRNFYKLSPKGKLLLAQINSIF